MVDEATKQTALRDIAKSKAIIAKHERKIDAWRVILEDDDDGPSVNGSDVDGDTTESEPSEKGSPTSPRNQSLGITAAVKQILPVFGNREFTGAMIETELKKAGILPDINQPRMRILMVLKRLEQQGEVERTFGPKSGTEPHRFQSIEKTVQ